MKLPRQVIQAGMETRLVPFIEAAKNGAATVAQGGKPQRTDGWVLSRDGHTRYRYWTDGSLRRE